MRFVSDNAGVIAFDLPELMNKETWFHVIGPIGPWSDAIHVVTHSNYTFYNPQLHAEFTNPDSPILLFEATYTKEFSGAPEATPRHDYNQVLYRLDLNELRDQ